jgi:hypothetical protein
LQQFFFAAMMGRTRVVWNFFSISDGKKQIAKCNLCKTLMSCKTTVSNLKKHLLRKHPTVQLFHEKVQIRNEDEEGTSGKELVPASLPAKVTTQPLQVGTHFYFIQADKTI